MISVRSFTRRLRGRFRTACAAVGCGGQKATSRLPGETAESGALVWLLLGAMAVAALTAAYFLFRAVTT